MSMLIKEAIAMRWTLVAAVIIGIAFGPIVKMGYDRLSDPGPPVNYKDAVVETPTVRVGEEARFVYHVDRYRACPAIIAGFWLAEDGLAAKRFPVESGGYGALGEDVHTPVERIVPDKPGTYCYVATISHLCGTGYTTRTPPVCVKVVE